MQRSSLKGCLLLIVVDQPLIALDVTEAFKPTGAIIATACTQAFVASSHFMSFIFSHSAELCGVSPRLSPDGVVATEDADHPLILVDHRQPADLQFLHTLRRLGEVIVLTAAMNA